MNEDVFPIENADFPMLCWLSRVQICWEVKADQKKTLKTNGFVPLKRDYLKIGKDPSEPTIDFQGIKVCFRGSKRK